MCLIKWEPAGQRCAQSMARMRSPDGCFPGAVGGEAGMARVPGPRPCKGRRPNVPQIRHRRHHRGGCDPGNSSGRHRRDAATPSRRGQSPAAGGRVREVMPPAASHVTASVSGPRSRSIATQPRLGGDHSDVNSRPRSSGPLVNDQECRRQPGAGRQRQPSPPGAAVRRALQPARIPAACGRSTRPSAPAHPPSCWLPQHPGPAHGCPVTSRTG
jgi:hypothetical protein